MTLRLNVWSGPRNVSTALMYAFLERGDVRAVDEPLYAHYLARSGARHPGAGAVLAAQDADGERVVREVVLGTCDRPVLFLKQMAHHLEGLDRAFLARTANVLLVREPEAVLTSFRRIVPDPSAASTGLDAQVELWEHLRSLGQDPPVIDAELLLRDPRGVLERLCRHLGLEPDEGMLTWEPGPRAEDGVWAPYWYASVHRSRGFAPFVPKTERVPPELEPVLAECRRHYQPLRAAAERFLAA